MTKKAKKTTRRKPKAELPARFVPRFWEDADSRLGMVRKVRERVAALREQTGSDSLQKDILCQRAVFLLVRLETVERRAIEDHDFPNVGTYVQAVNALSGILKTLGLESARKPVKNLAQYIEGGDE